MIIDTKALATLTTSTVPETLAERAHRLRPEVRLDTLHETRVQSLEIAHAAGVSDSVLGQILDTVLASRRPTIVLPADRLEHLSRGSGWCLKGWGAGAPWGERTDCGNYRVGPGAWTVTGDDGGSRRRSRVWKAKHITVGAETWTVAS